MNGLDGFGFADAVEVARRNAGPIVMDEDAGPIVMDQALLDRLVPAFTRKAELVYGQSGEDLDEVVACVIADTALVLDGTLTVEQFE